MGNNVDPNIVGAIILIFVVGSIMIVAISFLIAALGTKTAVKDPRDEENRAFHTRNCPDCGESGYDLMYCKFCGHVGNPNEKR